MPHHEEEIATFPGDTIQVWVAQFEPGEYGIEYKTESGITGGVLIGTREEAAHIAAAIGLTLRERTRTKDLSWL